VIDRAELLRQLELLHPDCFGWALSCCAGDRQEAEDVLHTAYATILEGRAQFNGRSSARTWVLGVIRMTARAHRRRSVLRWLRWERPLGDSDVPDPAPDPAATAEHSDESTRLLRALDTLPKRQREVLHLVFYQELSISEAADVLGISVGSARTHYERGKQQLRELLGARDR
jgi:RNA polymerase sigma-70 factor (ECF subfamily)